MNLSRPTILALRAAFAREGIAAITGIRRRKRRGTVLTPELEQKILDATLKTRPGDGSTHWSIRVLANHLRISRTIVHRVWQFHDVVGLYLNPPDRALVLCVDEIGTCQPRHRSREFIKFLNHLEQQLPPEHEVHLIMDNYCTHKSAEVQRWLKPKKRNRFHFHLPDG